MSYTVSSYTLQSADGVTACAGIAVVPEDHPRLLLEISHGMAEHMQRYLPMMKAMAEHGILCFGHEHAGHGSAARAQNALGYLPRRNGADILVADICCDAARFRSCYPDVPLILFGHSMGSFIARLAVTEAHNSHFDALILSGTGYKNPLSGIGLGLLRLLCTVRSEHAISPVMHKMIFGGYNNRFEKRTAFDWISSDPAAVDRYLADPLCGYPFTVSALYVLVSLLRACNLERTFYDTPHDLPIHLISGRDDPVGNYGVGVHAVADAYVGAGCTRVSHTLYTGARHELLNEPIAAQVIADLLVWIDQTVNPSPERSPA